MPFTVDQFLDVFEAYNTAVFPLQIIFNLLAIAAVLLTVKSSKLNSRITASILSFLWLWIGVVYHIVYFSSINGAAYVFGTLYIIQSIIFFYAGVLGGKFEFKIRKNLAGFTGWVFIAYALIIYPALGYLLGHGYPKQPTFGLPCPTTIFTFGILLFTSVPIKWYYLIIPLLWSLLGASAALQLGIMEDLGLLAAGLIGFSMLVFKKTGAQTAAQASAL